jgi:hypothetical protein
VRRLAASAQELLATPPSADGRPVLLAELYADATAAVTELNAAKPRWDPAMQGPLESEVVRSAITSERDALLADYTKPDAVAQRMDYKPAANVRLTD